MPAKVMNFILKI